MTRGCRWSEKSFSVAVKNKVTEKCRKCGKELGEVNFVYNRDAYCKECFSSMPVKCTWGEVPTFHTTKDKLFEFKTAWGSKEVEIHGKRQWQKFMKKHGIHDDCKQGWRKPKDYIKPVDKKIDRKWAKEQVLKELQERGLSGKVFKRK